MTLRVVDARDALFVVAVRGNRPYAAHGGVPATPYGEGAMAEREERPTWRPLHEALQRTAAGVSRIRMFVPKVGRGTRAGYSRVLTVRR
ncbi:MAG TPA: hypothetical protein VE440_03950 [Gaiellaceae bacterium]|nr:hypothetical protein [Gaiellaceae bacterium]